MLGTESEFSTWVSQALETRNSWLPSASAIFSLNSATSRVVRPSRDRISFNRSPAIISTVIASELASPWVYLGSHLLCRRAPDNTLKMKKGEGSDGATELCLSGVLPQETNDGESQGTEDCSCQESSRLPNGRVSNGVMQEKCWWSQWVDATLHFQESKRLRSFPSVESKRTLPWLG